MKIILEPYNNEWPQKFEILKAELMDIIGFTNPEIEHIGSTAVHGLSAKPIIDILVGVRDEQYLEDTVKPLMERGLIFYEIYNKIMPYRRFFVKHKPADLHIPNPVQFEEEVPGSTEEHNLRLAHIHILKYNSEHWQRHIAFRDYLRSNAGVTTTYQQLKEKLSLEHWLDGNDYNLAKDPFIKQEEKKAIAWYTQQQMRQP